MDVKIKFLDDINEATILNKVLSCYEDKCAIGQIKYENIYAKLRTREEMIQGIQTMIEDDGCFMFNHIWVTLRVKLIDADPMTFSHYHRCSPLIFKEFYHTVPLNDNGNYVVISSMSLINWRCQILWLIQNNNINKTVKDQTAFLGNELLSAFQMRIPVVFDNLNLK